MRFSIFILTCLLPLFPCRAKVITVDDNGPADFETIQAAIDDANNGDVILVRTGTYIGDGNNDIHFRGKAITVRSEKGPNATVVDCKNSSYGFRIEDNEIAEARLEGFTIRNAIYGAIKCYSSSPPRSAIVSTAEKSDATILYNPGYADVVITNCIITANQTIGIVCDGHDNVTVTNCDISRNGAQGVYCYMSWPVIKNCLVAENGNTGIRATGPTIANCTIVANQFDGVWAYEPNVTNSIIWANSREQIRNSNGNSGVTYSDVQGGWQGQGNFDADPLFADPDSSDYHLRQRSPCIDSGDPNYVPQPNETDLDGNPRIINSVIDMGAYEWRSRTWYIAAADSDDNNDGLTRQTPLATVQKGIDLAEDGDTVVVLPGTYTGDGNRDIDFKGKAITVRSEGGPRTCIIDCQGSWKEFHRGFDFYSGEDTNSVLEGFTVTGGYADWGGGIRCGGGGPYIRNCVIVANVAYEGGGLATGSSDPVVSNCVIAGNRARAGEPGRPQGVGGGVYCTRGYPSFRNCTIYGNLADGHGGGIAYGDEHNHKAVLENCILTANRTQARRGNQISVTGCTTITGCMTAEIVNCCIENEPNAIFWDEGAPSGPPEPSSYLQADPLFAKPGYWDPNGTPDIRNDDFWVDGDYHLKSQAGRWDPNSQSWVQDDMTSPCIDAGDPSTPIGDEAFPNGGTVNIGAYGGTAEASKSYFGEPVCETVIAGDINGDCTVDFADFAILGFHWLEDHNP